MYIKHDKRKEHSLTGRINNLLMLAAFKAVKKNRGAAGIDKISVELFEQNCQENITSAMIEIKRRQFKPKPLRRVYIPKGKGKVRPLGIPTVKDRVAQEVARRLLSPIFEKRFHENSYGFRPGRNCHKAIERVLQYIKEGYKYVVDADIKGFFDNIPHKLIMESVAAKVADGNILYLIESFLKCGVMEDGKRRPTTKGTPQGGVISPLLANIVLDHLDWYLDERGYKFVRYADDFVILCKDQAQAEKALSEASILLEDEMGLELSPEKTHVTHVSKGFEFLGFLITNRSVKVREKSIDNFKEKIRKLTIRKHNLEPRVIEKLNRTLRGTVNYFSASFTNTLKQFRTLDKWVRNRVRAMKYKRKWRTDNYRCKSKYLKRIGLLSSYELCQRRQRC